MNDDFLRQQLHDMSKAIKNIQEIYDISQSRLAEMMGVSRNVIADIEQEKRFPEMVNIFKLCHVLGISLTELSYFAFQNLDINTDVEKRTKLHKEICKSSQKTIYENAMEWRRKW